MALFDDIKSGLRRGAGAVGGFLFGKEGELPEEFRQAGEQVRTQRAGLTEEALRQARGEGQPSLAVQAIRETGRRAAEDIAAGERSRAAGARGLGALAAQRTMAANVAAARQGLASQVASEIARTQAAEQAAARQAAGGLLTDAERQLLMEEQLRQGTARPGMAGELLKAGIAAI